MFTGFSGSRGPKGLSIKGEQGIDGMNYTYAYNIS